MIPYVREIDVAYGRCDRISPLIRRVIADNPGPFTFTGTGAYIVGQGEVAVIDPGPDLPAHLDALLAAVKGERVTDILVTHTHADHSPLAAPLAAATGATVYGLPPPRTTADSGPLDEAHQADFRPDRLVAHGDRIAGPDWTLEAMPTPGHASNHVCYALLEENALFSGDHVMGWSTTVVSPPDGRMADYLTSLEAVAARNFTTLWPTHGPPITDVAPFLAAYRAHRLDREAQILDRLRAGDERIGDMVPVIYAEIDRRLWPAAAHSMLAHLIQLVEERRVVSDGPATVAARYRLA